MGYSYSDAEDNYVGAGPSIGGAALMYKEIMNKAPKGAYPCLYELINTGGCSNPQVLKGEAERFIKIVTNKNVRDSLQRLARAAALAKGEINIRH
jgi:hypothetical protein